MLRHLAVGLVLLLVFSVFVTDALLVKAEPNVQTSALADVKPVLTQEPTNGASPVISSVSPISAARLQTIYIRGAGFGDIQPVTMSLGDGSINTVGGGKNKPGSGNTPVIQVNNYARNTWGSGVQDSPDSGCCSIGIFLVSWSDNEIVLGGFGSALSTTGQGEWTIMPRDPMRIVVITPGGIATYNTTVISSDGTQPTPTSTPTPSQAPPTISWISPISPVRLQTIYINGSGFGSTPPQTESLGDGSVNTVDGGSTPAIQIRNNAVWGGWTAGLVGNGIGIILVSWSDTEIVLGGFGSALTLSTSGPEAWSSIMPGDPIDVLVKCSGGISTYSTAVTGSPIRTNFTNNNAAPVISSVSPIRAAVLQTIHIYGSGFGNTQPQTMSLGDGSIDTIGFGDTPVIQIHNDGWNTWEAGVQDAPSSGCDSIGIILLNWSDTEIVLGGFGSALSTSGQSTWNLMSGDPIRVVVFTSGGIAQYNTTVIADSDQQPVPTPTPQPTLPKPTLAVSCQSSTTYSNFKVRISGSLTSNETGIGGVIVLLSYSVDNGASWSPLTSITTDENGGFTVAWTPLVTGNFLIKAAWTGNTAYSGVNTTVNLIITPFEEQNVFSVTSNSTVSAFAFNSTSKELSFAVTGPTGTTGYVDIYVPKSLISDISSLKVYLDGAQLAYTSESQGDSWRLYFTYHHSTHQVAINFGSAQSSITSQNQYGQWLVIGAAAIAAIAFVAVLVVLKKKKHSL